MDLPHTPSSLSKLKAETAEELDDFLNKVDKLGLHKYNITLRCLWQDGEKRVNVQIRYYPPPSMYCSCEHPDCQDVHKTCFRRLFWSVYDDWTLEFFRRSVAAELQWLRGFADGNDSETE